MKMLPGLHRFVLACLLLQCAAVHAQFRQTGNVVEFEKITEVIKQWTPQTQLYVKQPIGVGAKQLSDLQDWLEKNGPHWTVVLMHDADNQVYQAANGDVFQGMDAVETALGKGLTNQTDFGKLSNPETQERDGAIFVLFLNERKFSYFSSAAQDRRGLGRSNWIGDLDQPAFRAMRGGGRIVDAVEDTVTNINNRLAQAIQIERVNAQRQVQERERDLNSLHATIKHAREQIDEAKVIAADFRSLNPNAKGPLTSPPLEDWRQAVEAIESSITVETIHANAQQLTKTTDAISQYMNNVSSAVNCAENSQLLEASIRRLSGSENPEVRSEVEKARSALAAANTAAKDGSTEVTALMSQANESITTADRIDTRDQRNLEQAQAIRKQVVRVLYILASLLTTLIVGLLGFFNWKRRPDMKKAQSQLSDRESAMSQNADEVDKLFTRNDELLGSSERLQQRGYVGKTKVVSEQALSYVNELFIISKEVRRVLSEARELVYPQGLWGRVVNMFSRGRYQRAMNQLTGSPLKFSTTSGLPRILRDSLPEGTNQNAEYVTLNFEEVLKAYNKREDEATQTLDLIDKCLTNVHESLSNSQTDLNGLNEQEKLLQKASEEDGYFALPSIFRDLIPTIESGIQQADKLSAFDAVEAMQVVLPEVDRKIKESRNCITHFLSAREKLFPILRETTDSLKSMGFRSSWIDDTLRSITSKADGLMKECASQSVASGVAETAQKLASLSDNAQEAVVLAKRLDQELTPASEAMQERIVAARQDMAKRLNLPQSAILNEINQQPGVHSSTAIKHLDAARSLLSLGQIEAVKTSIAAFSQEESHADAILIASKNAVENFGKQQQTASSELSRLRNRIPEVEKSVAPIARTFESSTLQTQNIDGKPVTARQLIQFAESPIDPVEKSLQLAQAEHKQGRVLHAAELQFNASSTIATAHQQLDQVEELIARVISQARDNLAEANRCADQLEKLQETARDPLVTSLTVAAINDAATTISKLRHDVSVSPSPNPFEMAGAISSVQHSLAELQARCAADRQAQAEAARAVAGARRQHQTALQLVRQAQTDNIPDSRVTVDSVNRISALGQAVGKLEFRLKEPHGNWKEVDDSAAHLQADISRSSDTLSRELKSASHALSLFQQASQVVFQAEQWSGRYGIRVLGSPGVRDLERARASLHSGDYRSVESICQLALAAAMMAIQQAEREVERQRMAEQRAAEEARRRQEATRRRPSSDEGIFGGGFGGFGGGSFGGGSSSGGSSGSRSSNDSGFSRSGW